MRVAAIQFASGIDVEENLNTCLRMIDLAAEQKPDILVLPEFCNHISWYDNPEQAWQRAVAIDGDFLQAIAERARRHRCFIAINVSLQRSHPAITVTSILFNTDGEIIAEADKQTLMGHENFFFVRAEQTTPVVETSLGRIGLFPCRDGVTCETPRSLALRGAQIFLDSLNSFALDEAALHVPARAPENKVFLVSANKIGPLVPEPALEEVSQATYVPVEFLYGAGESQIVSPEGKVLAKAPRDQEAVIVADIDISEADNKCRPDGTDIFATRRPELYSDIVVPPSQDYCQPAAATLTVSIACPTAEGEQAIAEVVALINTLPDDNRVLVLPELFCFEQAQLADPQQAADRSEQAVQQIAAACAGSDLLVCTSLVERTVTGYQHSGVLIDKNGIVAVQPQLHKTERHPWSVPGNEVRVFDLPWGKAAIVVGDDAIYPEVAKVAALRGVHCLLIPFNMQEDWEVDLGLLSRAAENRVCVVAATRPFAGNGGVITSLQREFTIMQPWQERAFDGNINYPIVSRQRADETVTTALIHPNAAANKVMSADTDLLKLRPWHLSQDLVDRCIGSDE